MLDRDGPEASDLEHKIANEGLRAAVAAFELSCGASQTSDTLSRRTEPTLPTYIRYGIRPSLTSVLRHLVDAPARRMVDASTEQVFQIYPFTELND